ncbi:hypothetical protein GCM10007216_06630 [Thalassobacillus devorans]|uniref:Uncharacterized protein n=1 Tax=Thalassobacillus devorans TaxID=279813 RepID=A0ABQ1NM69_9BACI|nr:hypothetical protein GCM10007216_06630 [Thalassobacillus devorans]
MRELIVYLRNQIHFPWLTLLKANDFIFEILIVRTLGNLHHYLEIVKTYYGLMTYQ